MEVLYIKPTCGFSKRTMAAADELDIELEIKDITESDEVRAELIERGGEEQVPFLYDDESGKGMYESDSIIAHFEKCAGRKVGEQTLSQPKVCSI